MRRLKPPMPNRKAGDRCTNGMMPPLAPRGTDPKSLRSFGKEPVVQHYTTDDGTVVQYRDRRQNHHSAKSHPRDIELVNPVSRELDRNLREAICADIRRGQGYPEVGLHKGMLWK